MTIPEARRLLLNLAATLDPVSAAEINRIVHEGMFRRRVIAPTRPKSRPTTRITKAQIRAWHKLDPDLSQLQIGVKVGVNPGRVSEALIGKRT